MPPSRVRKEEAELRQIAKKSRLARREAQQRERKQHQRARRAAATSGEAPPAAAEPAGASVKNRRRGAILLPHEVQELRQRLLDDDTASASSASGSGFPDRKKKKAEAKKAARSPASKSAGAAGASSHSAAFASSTLVPAYHQEVHFKKKMFFVDVVLHHIPHQKIDISETNASQLVVDTCGHTKRYRLVLPYPKGMRCDAAVATYEFENGILHCRLPIVDGTIPVDLEAENERMVEEIRQQKALRFRVTQDGDLTVRTRQALLAPTPVAQAALIETKKAAAAARRCDDADNVNDTINTKELEAEGREKAASPKSRKRTRDSGEEDSKEMQQLTNSASTRKAAGAASSESIAPKEAAAASKPATKKSKSDIFEAEHAKAMEAARAAAAKVHLSLRERVKLAKTVQANREERLKTRSLRKERKEEQRQQSFHRVLEEQKRQLVTRAAMQRSVPRPTPKANASAKSVRFADV
ncbi:hypothetical protein NXY56_000709 [Leishmania guyanensis]|uniref:Uncharacterized protein n=1 Tax=Leishmania guyanensis TaxID=5670 RepID=A0A1E1IPH1_LEIGU|nr:hypothetical protein, conserved [Leishmania guyanensis]